MTLIIFNTKITILILIFIQFVNSQNITDKLINLTRNDDEIKNNNNFHENEIFTNNNVNELTTLLPMEAYNINNNNITSENENKFNIELEIKPNKKLNDTNNLISTNKSNTQIVMMERPKTCSEINRKKLKQQPIPTDESYLRKCCPEGESSHYTQTAKYCDTTEHPFNVEQINAVLYDNCIEDTEEPVSLEIIAGNPCNVSFIYGPASGDQLYILQNGSLLILDQFGNDSMGITNNYCLDNDYLTGELLAVVCYSSINEHISRAQTILFAVFMVVSIPCLIFVVYIHFDIKELRTVHGLSLGMMSLSLAIGFTLHVYAQIFEIHKSKVGYAVQYFMLSYFFWMVMLCFNIVLTVWYFLPRYVTISRHIRYGRLATYSSIAFTIPLILVILTYRKKLPGMPSYFYQGWSESVQASQKYFIPPVSCCLILSLFLLIGSYFGFRQLDNIIKVKSEIEYLAITRQNGFITNRPGLDQEFLSETKKDTKCIAILLCIMGITWILEVVTFYSPGSGDHLAFMEILNGLQGLFILLIFIIGRDRRDIIVRWWHDRGSHDVTPVVLNKQRNPPSQLTDVELIDMTGKKSEENP